MENERIVKLLDLARDQATKRTDEGLKKAADILLHAIDQGCDDPQVMVTAASYVLQGPLITKDEIRERALFLLDKAVFLAPEDIDILENAVPSYELIVNDSPDKLDKLINICLKILEQDSNHIESMITLANHRGHPGVTLSLSDAIRMLEWATEVEPNNKFAASTLGRLYLEAGQYKKARAILKKVVSKFNPDSGNNSGVKDLTQSFSKGKIKRRRKYGIN
jgi:tetratricopeptide (TPR) repeat protein